MKFRTSITNKHIYSSIDSLYSSLLKNAESKYNKGDFSQLDLLNIKAKQQQVMLNLNSTRYNIENILQKLKTLMNYQEDLFCIRRSGDFCSP